jgi:hypothetical protein
VYEVTSTGNNHILTLTFTGYKDEPVGKLEAAILKMYKTLHGALPRESNE